MLLRKRCCLWSTAESVQYAAGWAVQLLLYMEWLNCITVQSVLRPHEMRNDQKWLLYHLHLRRQSLLCHVASLLRQLEGVL